ncbi:MAG: heme-binding protein [Alphaproteobacteria bacterium]|nr:heme-binding protein [Alphaproteobacteria bacterium]
MFSHTILALGVASIGCVATLQAKAQLLEHKDLSLAAALAIATAAADHCKAQGYTVSVAVVGREAQILVQLRGDGSPPHSVENSYRRAYTARTYKQPSRDVEKRVRADPTDQLVHLDHIMAAQGGLPITVGGDVIGAVAVSGSPGGDKDEACAQAGLDKVASVLR